VETSGVTSNLQAKEVYNVSQIFYIESTVEQIGNVINVCHDGTSYDDIIDIYEDDSSEDGFMFAK